MKIFRFLAPVLLLMAGIGIIYAGRFSRPAPPATPEESSSDRLLLVEAEPFSIHQGPLRVEVDGTVVPFREVRISSEVTGRVLVKQEVCRAGKVVSQGTALLQIDPADYELDAQRLENQVQQAVVNLQEVDQELSNSQELLKLATADLQLRARDIQRLRQLTIGKGVSENEFDAALRAEIAAKNSRQTMVNQIQLYTTRRKGLELAQQIAQSQLKRAQLDLERTQITMPLDGVVVADLVEQGDFVQRGTPLLTVEDTSAVEVKCNLEMDDLYWVWSQPLAENGGQSSNRTPNSYAIPPTPVTIIYQMANREKIQYTWKGVLTRYDGIGLDETTRTVPCRVLVPDPQAVAVWDNQREVEADSVTGPRALVRGMYVTVALEINTTQRIVRVPSGAFRVDNTVGRVRDGQFELLHSLRVVGQLKHQNHKYWLIEASEAMLTDGDQVVTSPTILGLSSGMAVKVYRDSPQETEGEASQ